MLAHLIERFGADHVLLGTDYPYDMGMERPVEFIDGVKGLSAAERAAIQGGNAARLLKIDYNNAHKEEVMNFTRRKVLALPAPPRSPRRCPATFALAQQGPVKIGMSMPQTGTLGAGGQAALLALRMWVEDVNEKGGLLGRKVELIAYDDQTNPANTPGIYTKLLDVDKVDLLIAPYGTVPTAPIMPLVKQRGLLLMGNFSFQVNAHGASTTCGSTTRRGTTPRAGPTASSQVGPEGGREDHRVPRRRQGLRAEPRERRARARQEGRPEDGLRPELSADAPPTSRR